MLRPYNEGNDLPEDATVVMTHYNHNLNNIAHVDQTLLKRGNP